MLRIGEDSVDEQPGYVTPAGWYVDPATDAQLRWWSGQDWTEHVAPLVEHRPEPAARPVGEPGREPGSEPGSEQGGEPDREPDGDRSAHAEAAAATDEPEPPLSRRERRALEEAAAAARALPPPVARIAPITSYAWEREADKSETTFSSVPRLVPEHAEENVLQLDLPGRWSTASVWTIAFMPWIAVVSTATALLLARWGFAWWLPLGALMLPFLITLAAAQRDVKRLRSWRHRTVAHWAWSLLGSLAYLIARTVVLRRHAGFGSAPLWVGTVNTLLAVGAAVALVVAALASLTGIQAVMANELTNTLAPTYGPVQVECPRTAESLSFACTMTDAGGATRSVWVELNPADGSYTWSVTE